MTTRTITDPEQWTIGDHVTVTHRDGAVTTGRLSEEYGYLYVGGTTVRYGSGNYSHLDVVVTREVEEIAEPTRYAAVVELGSGRPAIRMTLMPDVAPWFTDGWGWISWADMVAKYGVARVVFEGVNL